MRSVNTIVIALGVVLLCGSGARADLYRVVPHDQSPDATVPDAISSSSSSMFVVDDPGGLADGMLTGADLPSFVLPRDDENGNDTLVVFPELPSSSSLFLSAMLSLACVGLACSARDANLSSLPGWYHTGGPAQIGHATPLPLEYGFAGVVVCVFDVPCDIGATRFFWGVPDFRTDDAVRHFVSTEVPRGPPFRI